MDMRIRASFIIICIAALCIAQLTAAAQEVRKIKDGKLPYRFSLQSSNKPFYLTVTKGKDRLRINISKEWLMNVHDGEEDSSDVSPYKYEKNVTPFLVGDDRVGIHISSCDVNDEGSIHAAAGKDVFLIYNPKKNRLQKGLVDIGITKERYRNFGCFKAKSSHFILADINNDGLTDLGIVREEIVCVGDDESGLHSSPSYMQELVRWHILKKEGWVHEPEFDGVWPKGYDELPLIGIVMTPVDFAASYIWNTYDPSRWESTGYVGSFFVPGYRKKLMQETSITK